MKPSIPKGTRDFSPEQLYKRNFIFQTIREVFEIYGYAPIETPSMENLQVLSGKYGEEGDTLLFKVLNNGDYLDKADPIALEQKNSKALISSISKRGLRYDLTVPFARYVVMHQNEIQLPFKRYQIQPVWRADRPQKGRYQEFYQCDADVVGSDSLVYEAELLEIYNTVFKKLGLQVNIKVNNRKLLAGLAEIAGMANKFMDLTIALDKLDKIGEEGVRKEMLEKRITDLQVDVLFRAIASCHSLEEMEQLMSQSEIGKEGVNEIRKVLEYCAVSGATDNIDLDITLARGLNYYTGCIFEVQTTETAMGSIGGGGRYADLTAAFGLPGVSGVGISFGAERIYDVMEYLERFPANLKTAPKVMVAPMDEESMAFGYNVSSILRSNGISTDLYPEPAKLKKQLKYASERGFAFCIICGEKERRNGLVSVKNLSTTEQEDVPLDLLSAYLSSR
ncbi:MAG: histidine--tRNA ligase [Saprospiraceae bacterium]|nr:histidine--tRNA ligase [Saprospiraceae bacterium]